MDHNGHIRLVGTSAIKNFKPETLAADPTGGALAESVMWFNGTEKALKFYDGTSVNTLAVGGNLTDYINRDGSVAMTADLLLVGTDQTGSASNAAISKGHFDTGMATKQDTVTGAATSITGADLTAERVAISDASGKVAVSAVTTTELGYVAGVTSGVQNQLDGKQDDLGYAPLNKAGDAWLGAQSANGYGLTNLPAPVNANDAARKIDLDTAIANLNWQDDVLNIQLDATLDPGAAPAEGDRYIITNAAALHANFGTIADLGDNDIVEYVSTEFVVAFDMSAQGVNAAGTFATNIADGSFYRYNGAWARFEGMDSIVAGIGLARSGNTFNVNMGAGVSQLPSDEVGIDLFANRGLMLTVDGSTASTDTDAQLAVVADDASINFAAGGALQVKAQGIAVGHLGAIASNGLQGGNGVELSVKAHTGILVNADGVARDTGTTDALYARLDGTAFTGEVTVLAPTAAMNPATKQYADGLKTALDTDVADVNTRVSSGHFVYDSTATGTDTASASHTVTHNIGTKYVQVTVVDEADEVIGVDSITYVDENSLTVGLTVAIKCRVIVTGVAPAL